MIVELFGPSGAGKSTLAHALMHRLREHGHVANIVFSYRPGEYRSMLDPGGFRYAVRRVTFAVANTIAIACHPLANAQNVKITANLLAILPPRNVVWLIRLGLYILRLTKVWREPPSADIIIFDQGVIQAVCSLALYSRAADETSLVNALNVLKDVPEAELLIRLDCPQKLLEARLNGRLRRESFMERQFEGDVKTNLRGASIVDRVNALLRTRGRAIVCVTVDQHSLNETLDRIEEDIVAKLDTKRKMAAMQRTDAARQ